MDLTYKAKWFDKTYDCYLNVHTGSESKWSKDCHSIIDNLRRDD